MLGANERERDGDGGEVSAGMRYPLLMPCTLPRALVDINGGTGKKSVMSYVADPEGLVRGRPRVNLATKCEWLNCDTLFDTLARNNVQCPNQSCSVMSAVTHAPSAKVPFKIEMFLS